jgi:hypothetical protein
VSAPEFVAVLEHVQKWRGPRQSIAIFSLKELSEMLPDNEVARLRLEFSAS